MHCLNIEQGTPEWHEFRKKGIGGSDAPIITGLSKYKTPYQLWQIKLGLADNDKESFIADVGSRMETSARARFALETNIDVIPVCAIHDEFDFLRASFDGVCENSRLFLEIKMIGKERIEWVRKNKSVLPDHADQVAHQFLVSGYERGFYCCYTVDGKYEKITDYECIQLHRPSPAQLSVLFESVKSFWQGVLSQNPPPLTEKDEYEFKDKDVLAKAKSFLVKKTALQKAQEDFEGAEAELKAIASAHPLVRIGDVVISTIVRKGNVDYKSIPQLAGLDLEKFRGRPSSYKKIDVRAKC